MEIGGGGGGGRIGPATCSYRNWTVPACDYYSN